MLMDSPDKLPRKEAARKEVHRLVVSVLENGPQKANILYMKLQMADPDVVRRGCGGGVISFSKIIQQFPDVKQVSRGIYTVKKNA